MSNLTIIAAVGKNNELGKSGKLIWHLPKDLKFFKSCTLNKTIIMGYNTYLSLGRLLPNRKHVVLTRTDRVLPEEVDIYHSTQALMENIDMYKEPFVIGGAEIYCQFIDKATAMYLTEIEAVDSQADTYFPYFNTEAWDKEVLSSSSDNDINFKHVLYKRRIG